MSKAIGITCRVPREQRAELEQLLFFNGKQHLVRSGIEASIETYGVPEICEADGGLTVRVGNVEGVQTLFALSEGGQPVGAAVFTRLGESRFVILHVGVQAQMHARSPGERRILRMLMHEIREAARRTRGVRAVELVYRRRAEDRP